MKKGFTGTVYECKCSQKPTQEVIRHCYAQLQWYYLLGAKDEKLIKELEEHLARQGNFVRLVYDETMTRLMNE